MTLNRRQFNHLLIASLGYCALPAAAAELVEGEDWRAINPPYPSDIPGKIEVLEFFSYGCPHCSHLNPLLTPWAEELPEDVAFRQVPVSFGRAAWKNLSQLFFALKDLGRLDDLHQAVFDAMQKQRIKLYREDTMIAWLKEQDVDTDEFMDVFNSFDVQTQVGRSDYLVDRFKIDAVPTLTVGGKYAVLGRNAKSLKELLTIADGLIAKTRANNTSA
ncbi:thiol:disulfide interchange protein DsbA/DsbL [Imhoffiella purpurea]|uniref:Thiol:disulfide interchange protein n=1 Tax=Imhoffiella purpurea TaxID=1249627 RepID=W9V668_9GAMM|nr:thiol:disulfide interchange protein DsbA/DsbL [Imhoffiella purpurea]EXJ15058.1 Periplasmic thiol:disulfide interchange protein DsbA [Imhoffiella purpurea]